jgi:hypothetical protein
MRQCVMRGVLIVLLAYARSVWAQDNSPAAQVSDHQAADEQTPSQQAAAEDDSTPAQPASYDDVSAPGQIHGFIPDTWTASMITLADLQTQDGQGWLNGLTAAQSIQGQTQYVCQNPGPATTSSDTGDFYFYDLPAGSYVVAACMQTPDGHWRSGAQVIALDAGQDELVALGPAGGMVMRAGDPFVPAFYVSLWDPMWFGPGWVWGWHPATAWQASVNYHSPAYRSAPIWVRPAPVVVGVHLFVPPYKEVIRGNYHYLAFRNGRFVRESPHVGCVVPPQHAFHPITPAMEVKMSLGGQVRPGVYGGVQTRTAVPARPVAPARPSPFVNYHPTPTPVNTPAGNNPSYANGSSNPANASRPLNQNNTEPRPQYTQPQYTPQPQVAQQSVLRPQNRQPAPAPREEYHTPPAPRQEYHAPPPEPKPTTTKRPY